jgi:hypothetical protein
MGTHWPWSDLWVDTWDREPPVTNIHLTEMTEKRPRVLKTSLIILSLFCIHN